MQLTRFLDQALSSTAKVRLLRRLCLDSKPRSGRELAREVGMAHAPVRLALEDLDVQGLVRRDRVGRAHAFSLRRDVLAVREVLIPLFQRERGLPDAVAKLVVAGIRTRTLAVAMYGSVAAGSDEVGSDLDLAFVVRTAAQRSALEDELSGQVGSIATTLGAKLSPYVVTQDELRRRFCQGDHLIRKIVRTGRRVSGLPLLEVIRSGRSKAQDTGGRP